MNGLNRTEATSLVEAGILDDLAGITTVPNEQQIEALNSLRATDIAPREVCAELDLDQGSTWADVVRAIREDVEPDVAARIQEPA